MPQLWIIAGPNGAGKTTLASKRIAAHVPVVNPDEIARELPSTPRGPDLLGAGKAALERRKKYLATHASFAVETTLTGKSPLRLMKKARESNYKITLVFIGLASVELSIQRVADRVKAGGHAVSLCELERRFPAALKNLALALEIADRSYVLDNSGPMRRLLAIRENGIDRFVSPNLPSWFLENVASADPPGFGLSSWQRPGPSR